MTTEYADDSGAFINGLDLRTYAQTINHISEIFLDWIESNGLATENDKDEDLIKGGSSIVTMIPARGSLKASYIELLKPVHQQWHLRCLLSVSETSISNQECTSAGNQEFKSHGNSHLLNVVLFYYCMVRIYASLNPLVGPLPILNMLSFTPGFTVKLWELLEGRIFNHNAFSLDANEATRDKKGSRNNEEQIMTSKASGNKWVNVLAKIAGKSYDADFSQLSNGDVTSNQIFEDAYEFWDVEPLKQGCQGISKELQCVLYLFCSVYAHLLLVLDDIEFYEKQVFLCPVSFHSGTGIASVVDSVFMQVPFTLSRQQRISSVLNTFVYGSFIHNCSQNNQLLIDAAVRCLTLLYERDSRHKFCPPSLWVAPAWKSRLPIPAAARSHEALSSNPHCRDASGCHRTSSVISTIPHVFPFEER